MEEDQLIAPVSSEMARAKIQKHFPRLTIETLDYLGGGSASTFAVNRELIFRFPKMPAEEADERYQREVRLLKLIRARVAPHQIPTPLDRLQADDIIFQKPVYVYSFLEGTQVAKLRLNVGRQQILAALLGDFLSRLHSINLESVYKLGVTRTTPADITQTWRLQYERVQKIVYPRLDEHERTWVARLYEKALADADVTLPPIVLTHGDLGAENILVPEHFNHLQVVDFEDARPFDRAVDFCLWWGERGEDFLDRMLKTYTGQPDPHFRLRLQFYFNRTPLLYLEMGVQSGNENAFQFGRDLLNQRMRRTSHTI